MVVDPYIYENGVLKNRLEIKDGKELSQLEKDLSELAIIEILSWDLSTHTIDYHFIKKIHKTMFSDIYDWSGEERTIGISKEEEILNGKSIQYGNPKTAEQCINYDIQVLNNVKWETLSIEEKVDKLIEPILNIWEVHPFRDGNTRTVITFILLYSKKNNFLINLRGKSKVRDSFVKAVAHNDKKELKEFLLEAMKK